MNIGRRLVGTAFAGTAGTVPTGTVAAGWGGPTLAHAGSAPAHAPRAVP